MDSNFLKNPKTEDCTCGVLRYRTLARLAIMEFIENDVIAECDFYLHHSTCGRYTDAKNEVSRI